ncbi:MAG: two-component regulator propeller domain-containing protein [Terracidiphilus sp.]
MSLPVWVGFRVQNISSFRAENICSYHHGFGLFSNQMKKGMQPKMAVKATIARTTGELLWRLHGIGGILRYFLCSSLIAIAGLACAQEPPRLLSQYAVRNYTTEQGLPQNEVRSIAQTPDGYLWFGTNDGLARFDGVKFTVYRQESTPGIGHNMFSALVVDHLGRLWIATGDGLSCYEHGIFRRFTEKDGLPAKPIHTLLADNSGKLWIGTWNGLAVFDGIQFRTLNRKDGLPEDSISALAEDGAGGLWVGTYNSGLAHMAKGKISVSTEKDGLPSNFVQTLFRDREGRLWVGTLKGSALLDTSGHFQAIQGLPGRYSSFYQDHSGSIWSATDKTFARLRMAPGPKFERKESLSLDVDAVFEDRDGSLWVGTSSSGVVRYRPGPFITYTEREGLIDKVAATLFEDSKGRIWVGGYGLSVRSSTRFHPAALKQIGKSVVWSLAEDGAGAIWVATMKGTFRFDGQSWTRMGKAQGIAETVHCLYSDRAGRIWLGSLEGLTIWDHGRTSKLTLKDGLPSNYVMSILEDREGAFWIGTVSGLTRFDHGKFTTYTTADGLLNNFISALYEDSSGTLWICTPSGLNRFKNGRFKGFTVKEGMFADNVLQLLEDDRHNFWISSFRGLFRINRDQLNAVADGSQARIDSVAYGQEDGIKSGTVGGPGVQPAGWKSRDGTLWFPTNQGVVEVDPTLVQPPIPPPVPLLQDIFADGVVTQSTIFGPEIRRIDFQFTAPTSVQAEAIEYRYRMDGYEDKWHEVGTKRQISFTNLPQGTYHFFVSARRGGGPWSAQEASASISVEPHFYETRWFYSALGLSAFLLIWMANSLRVWAIERRLTGIMAERSRVAQELHDTLLQAVSGTAMEIQGGLGQLRNGSTEAGIQQLSSALEHLGISMADARQAIWDLRSPEHEHGRLDLALESAAQRICGTSLHLCFTVAGKPTMLAETLERQLYRIGIEAVMNAVRHSNGSELTILLEYADEAVSLIVRDNGRGFNYALAETPSHSNHWGLAGMKQRAQQCSADLTIETAPGQGTCIRVNAPLTMRA